MSVWGSNPRYIVGAKRQYELAKEFYPDWKFRIYTDNRSNFTDLPDIEIVDVTDGSYGMYWRFRAMFESDDNIVIVRDSDSRITEREAKAVNEWLASDKKFHTFRDHIAHFEFPIIGCAFGYKGKLPAPVANVMDYYIKKLDYYVGDQIYLRDVVYPAVKDSMMVHSMDSGWFGETRKSLVNPYDFCGNGYDENDMPLYPPTMEEMQTFDATKLSADCKFNKGRLWE